MISLTRCLLAASLAAACTAAPRPMPVSTVSNDASSAVDVAGADVTVVDAASVDVATEPFSISARIPEGRGVILGERPGATVTLRPAHGPNLTLADGERVTFIEEHMGVGTGDAYAIVEARGERGAVPNARVVTEERLQRAPRGSAAVFTAIATCGDFCHSEVWLVGDGDARAQITADAGPEVVVAWSPDGARLALGSGALYRLTLADVHAVQLDGFTAPAFASDGSLFVRGARTDDAVFALGDGAPRRVYAPPGRPPPVADGEATLDPTPVTFERDGALLRAEFRRGARVVVARFGRDGRGATVLSPAAATSESFVRVQMGACNAERVRLGERPVFAPGTEVTALRPAPPRGVVVRIARPGVEAVDVVAIVASRQIRHPRGATVSLGGGLDFCPPAVWLGPHHD